jgi:hypothetical protein
MTDRFKADIAFFVISCVVWLITIAFVVVDPLEGGGCNAMKFPSMGVLGFTAVVLIVLVAIAAADRAGRANFGKVGEVSNKARTKPHQAALALTGACLGFVVSLAGIGLLFAGMWGKDDTVSRGIRTVWTLLAAVAVFFLGAMSGIWAHYAHERSIAPFDPRDPMPFGSYFKAEFAFEIIGSVMLIASITLFAAFGAGEAPSDA